MNAEYLRSVSTFSLFPPTCHLQNLDGFFQGSSGGSGLQRGDAVAGIEAGDNLKRLHSAIYEIRPIAAVNVDVNETGSDVHPLSVNRRARDLLRLVPRSVR